MSPEEALIRGVEADPAADLPRLVYADWLDENGRGPFADFLRTELELAKLPLDSPAAPALRERLWRARAAVDVAWLHRLTQPRMLRANPTPFPARWLGFGLGTLRLAIGYYGSWPYDSVPPLPVSEFLGTFDYLGEPQPLSIRSERFYAPRHVKRLDQLVADVTNEGYRLPTAFLDFMRDYRRVVARESAVTWTFFLPESTEPIVPAMTGSSKHIPFCAENDRNTTPLFWDLLVHPGGGSCVVARLSTDSAGDPARPTDAPSTWFVAPSFEAFRYRVWMENRLLDVGHENSDFIIDPDADGVPPVTPAIQAYIDHYRKSGP